MKAFSQFDREGFRKLATVTGVLIIATFAMIQAVHIHSEYGLADNAHCASCAVAHASAAIIVPAVSPALVFVSARLVLFEPPLRKSAVLHLHYSRPPPPTPQMIAR